MKISILAVPVIALLCSTASAQSLADVARKAEEERARIAAENKDKNKDKDPGDKDQKDAPKVITNEDLKTHPGDAALNAAAAKAEKAKAADEKAAAKKPVATDQLDKNDPKQTEAYWRRRATELHNRLAADEQKAREERVKVERFRHNTESIGCFACPARNQLESQLIRMDEEQAHLDAKVESDRAAIQDFEEEGRRLGILPGWLRP
jgi:hypothetical protein